MTDVRFSVTPFKVSGTNLTSGRQHVFLLTRQRHVEPCILSGLHVTHTHLFFPTVKIHAFKNQVAGKACILLYVNHISIGPFKCLNAEVCIGPCLLGCGS